MDFDIESFKNAKVAVFGDFMVDKYLQGYVSRISPEAPVPVVNVQSDSKRLGGAGNVIRNLEALGAQATAIGLVGHDSAGNWLIGQLKESGTNISGMRQLNEISTSIKTRVTAQNQQLLRYDREVIHDAPETFIDFLEEEIDALLHDACALIISDYGKGTITEKTAQITISAAKRANIPVVIDPKGNNYQKYRGATVCTPNTKELQEAVGRELCLESEIKQAALELCNEYDLRYILVTRSEKGMSLIDGLSGIKSDYPALAKEIIDVTGAGDTVIAVFTLCFARGAKNDECCRLANLAASVVISKFGAAVVTSSELQSNLIVPDKATSKLLSTKEAAEKVSVLHKQGKKVVFTNGCYDIIHAGHVSCFEKAKQFGDYLIVGVNSDDSIRRIKGDKRPIISQYDRVALLCAISYIDYIVVFDDDTPENLIRIISPDVLVKGMDWKNRTVAGGDFVQQNGGQLCFIDFEYDLSTTRIINKILDIYGNKK